MLALNLAIPIRAGIGHVCEKPGVSKFVIYHCNDVAILHPALSQPINIRYIRQ